MKRFLILSAAAFALSTIAMPETARAQFGGMGGGMGGGGRQPFIFMQGNPTPRDSQDFAVEVNTLGGKSVAGRMKLSWVVVNYELGRYEIEPEKVKEINFTPTRNDQLIAMSTGVPVAATILTTTGLEIAGMVMIHDWKLFTDLGVLTIQAGGLKSLTIKGKATLPDGNAAKPQQIPSEAQPAPKEVQSPLEKK